MFQIKETEHDGNILLTFILKEIYKFCVQKQNNKKSPRREAGNACKAENGVHLRLQKKKLPGPKQLIPVGIFTLSTSWRLNQQQQLFTFNSSRVSKGFIHFKAVLERLVLKQ